MTATLLLVDDHPLFQGGFASMLREQRPDWRLRLAGSAADGCAALAADPAVDLVIVDIQLPDGDGFAAVAEMGRLCPLVPRALISGREDVSARRRALQCGASGFIAKAESPDAIVARIETILAGGVAFDPLPDDAGETPVLTARQGEVLALLCEGHGNKEIRHRLGIAERTVRAHLTELFHLLGASSRVQAILKARELGLAG